MIILEAIVLLTPAGIIFSAVLAVAMMIMDDDYKTNMMINPWGYIIRSAVISVGVPFLIGLVIWYGLVYAPFTLSLFGVN